MEETKKPVIELKEVIDLRNTDFNALVEKAERIEKESTDYMVTQANSNNVRFNDNFGLTFVPDEGEVEDLRLTHHSLGQLGTKIGVPSRYIEKCIASGRIDLAKDNVNSWLEDYNKSLFIREYRGRIRGILSNKYSVCDSDTILNVFSDVMGNRLANYDIKGNFLNEERLHLRMVNKERMNIDGEDLFSGIFIDSSDVGRSILKVNYGVYKLVCTNGLVIAKAGGTLFEQKHVGISADDLRDGLKEAFEKLPVLEDNARQWIEFARNTPCKEVAFDIKHLSEEDMDSFVESIRQKTMLSKESATKVVELMRTKYDGSKWGLINGITEVAQDFTLERRLELETIAGGMLVA